MDMVERVARALYKLDYSHEPGNWGMYLGDARAAIEAMRLPAGSSSVPGGIAIEESMFASDDTVFHGAAKCWNAMIDAALSAVPVDERE